MAMKPLPVLFVLDIALLTLAYWYGSLLGLALVIALCFAVALGSVVFSNAMLPEQWSNEEMALFSDSFLSSFTRSGNR